MMATGDRDDMLVRIKVGLPPWFGDANPFLDAILTAAATILAFAYSLIAFAKSQTRLATASGAWLDLFSHDFFGSGLPRVINESDANYRTRIASSLFKPKATRKAISDAVQAITGVAPTIIEPFSPADCGAYSVGYCGYSLAGAYGSSNEPATVFLITQRPVVPGVAYIGGYSRGPWGYGVGNGCYTQSESVAAASSIYSAIANTKAEGVEVWVAFDDYTGPAFLATEGGAILGTETGGVLTI